MAIIYTVGSVSGAPTPPSRCPTPCDAIFRGDECRATLPPNWSGGVAAVAFLRVTVGDLGHLGASTPGPGVTGHAAFLIEDGAHRRPRDRHTRHRLGPEQRPDPTRPSPGRRLRRSCWSLGRSPDRRRDGVLRVRCPQRSLPMTGRTCGSTCLPLAGGAIAVGFAWILLRTAYHRRRPLRARVNANDARGDPRPGSAP